MRSQVVSGGIGILVLLLSPLASAQGDCDLEEITLELPIDGAEFYLEHIAAAGKIYLGIDPEQVALQAVTDCDDAVQNVTFFLEKGSAPGVRVQVGFDTVPPFESAELIRNLDFDEPLTFSAVATPLDADAEQLEDEATIVFRQINASNDADANGLPDRPFERLTQYGDYWEARTVVSKEALERLSVAANVYGQQGDRRKPTQVLLQGATHADQPILLEIPAGLLRTGEIAVAVAQIAPEPEQLFGSSGISPLTPIPQGEFGGDAYYLTFSILVSRNGGVSFEEIASSRLEAAPVRVTFRGLTLDKDLDYALMRHEARTTTRGGRLVVEASGGSWQLLPGLTIERVSGTVSANITRTGVLAPFAVVDVSPGTPADERTLWGILLTILSGLGIFQLAEGSPCFIATAAYGTPLAAEVDVLRGFRDACLLNNVAGTAFVDVYYQVSPALAGGVAQHPALAWLVRGGILLLLVGLAFWKWLAVAAAMAIWGIWRRARRPCGLHGPGS